MSQLVQNSCRSLRQEWKSKGVSFEKFQSRTLLLSFNQTTVLLLCTTVSLRGCVMMNRLIRLVTHSSHPLHTKRSYLSDLEIIYILSIQKIITSDSSYHNSINTLFKTLLFKYKPCVLHRTLILYHIFTWYIFAELMNQRESSR